MDIYLSPPHLQGDEIESLQRVLAENWIAPVGPDLDSWERELSEFTGSGVVLTHSCTSALHLALRNLNITEGDLVLVQSLTHIGGVNPILYERAIPVFIDSEPDSWNMDPAALRQAIEDSLQGKLRLKGRRLPARKPVAIIPVHLFGMPAEMDTILQISREYDIPLIEDAAESVGSTYKGQQSGTLGAMGVYSFNGNKIITCGGGGALVSDNADFLAKALYLSTQARDTAPHYQHSEMGFNYRLSNVLAAIGRRQLSVLAQRIESKRANFMEYSRFFEGWNQKGFNIKFQEENPQVRSNRWLTAILLDPSHKRELSPEHLRLALLREKIESRPIWKPMHQQPIFAGYPFVGSGVSDQLFQNGLCLPSGSALRQSDFEKIFDCLSGLFKTA